MNYIDHLIPSGSFILEYAGELISKKEADKREMYYSKVNYGSYMFYFRYENRDLW